MRRSKAELEDIRDSASGYLNRELTDTEWKEAHPAAEQKLDRIINREGDCSGERSKVYYIAQLIAEQVRESAFSKYTLEAYKARKAALKEDDPSTTLLYTNTRRIVNPATT